MAELGWDARFNRPAVSPTPGPAGESTFVSPPSVEAVLSQLQRWEQALQAEVQAETDSSASACNLSLSRHIPAGSTQALEAMGTKKEDDEEKAKDERGGDRDGSDIDVVAAMMAAAMR